MLHRIQSCIRKNRLVLATGAGFFIITCALFLKTARYDFVDLDDGPYVFANAHVQQGLNLHNIAWAFTSMRDAGCWMPLTWLSYMTDSLLFGTAPGVFHAVNVVYHACNAALFFLLLWVLFVRQPFTTVDGKKQTFSVKPSVCAWAACVCGALFWAVHPLRVEPVAWVSGRKDVLSTFWELLALLCWVESIGWRSANKSLGRWTSPETWQRMALICFSLALLAKPTAMTFPVLAALLEIMLTRQLHAHRFIDYAYIGLAGCLMAMVSQRSGGATMELTSVPLQGRLLNAIASIGLYARDTVHPAALAIPYLHAWPLHPVFLGQGLVICALAGILLAGLIFKEGRHIGICFGQRWHSLHRLLGNQEQAASNQFVSRFLLAGLLWIVVAITPMLGFSSFGYHSHADRFTYIPAMGLSIILTGGLLAVTRRFCVAGVLSSCGLLVALVCLARASSQQMTYWENDETLFTHTLQITGDTNKVAHQQLGIYYFRKHDDLATAVSHFGKAIDLDGKRVPSHFHALYAIMLAEAGQLQKAQFQTRLAEQKQLKGNLFQQAECFTAHGAILLADGNSASARDYLNWAVVIAPQDADAHYVLGNVALKTGNIEEATQEWRKALEDPDRRYEFLRIRVRN